MSIGENSFEWVKVGRKAWDFKEKAVFSGFFMRKTENKVNKCEDFIVEDFAGVEWLLWSKAVLHTKLDGIAEATPVRIVYLGVRKGEKREYDDFDVYVGKAKFGGKK